MVWVVGFSRGRKLPGPPGVSWVLRELGEQVPEVEDDQKQMSVLSLSHLGLSPFSLLLAFLPASTPAKYRK